MKIRRGFVSNSSSSSFLLAVTEEALDKYVVAIKSKLSDYYTKENDYGPDDLFMSQTEEKISNLGDVIRNEDDLIDYLLNNFDGYEYYYNDMNSTDEMDESNETMEEKRLKAMKTNHPFLFAIVEGGRIIVMGWCGTEDDEFFKELLYTEWRSMEWPEGVDIIESPNR